jgi:hypothetical protein
MEIRHRTGEKVRSGRVAHLDLGAEPGRIDRTRKIKAE